MPSTCVRLRIVSSRSCRPARRDREAAIADHRGRDAERGRGRHVGSQVICASKWVWLSMMPGISARPSAVDHLRARTRLQRSADRTDAASAHREIGSDRVGAAAVVERSAANKQVIHGSVALQEERKTTLCNVLSREQKGRLQWRLCDPRNRRPRGPSAQRGAGIGCLAKNDANATAIPRGFCTCRRCVVPGSTKPSAFGSQLSSCCWRSFQIGDTSVLLLADHGERRLRDAARILAREPPLLDGGQFLAEERVGIRHAAIEGAGQRPIERRAVRGRPTTMRMKPSTAPALSPLR